MIKLADEHRRNLLAIYQAALKAVSGDRVVDRWLRDNPQPACAVVAIGKAAACMMKGALNVLDERLISALVITKVGHAGDLATDSRIEVVESGHPEPDAASLQAGNQLLAFLQRQTEERPLLFLISGGASSLVEVLPPDLELEELRRLNRWLLGSGLDIRQMNQIRQCCSQIKGGGLLDQVAGRSVRVLLISDVPGDDPAIIGSGLLHPPLRPSPLPPLPGWVQAMLPHRPAPSSAVVPHHLVATLDQALDAAARKARLLGYRVHRNHPFLRGDAGQQGEAFGRFLRDAPPGIHLYGGETTVVLPAEPGHGGRNQHLALAAATAIEGQQHCYILAAGTDGSDGSSQDAGALVDGGTVERAGREGFDAHASLEMADAGRVLEATGDLLHTGPTGTNVMDLLFGLNLE